MSDCGALGPAFGGKISTRAKKDPNRWINWATCKHIESYIATGPLGQVVSPRCKLGHVVERVAGAHIGRLFRGRPCKCNDFEEIINIVKPQLVTREQCEAIAMNEAEIVRIVGPKFIV